MGILRDVIAQRRDQSYGNSYSTQPTSRGGLLPRLSDYTSPSDPDAENRARGSRCDRRGNSRLRQMGSMMPSSSPQVTQQQQRYYTSVASAYPTSADPFTDYSQMQVPTPPILPTRPPLLRARAAPIPAPIENFMAYQPHTMLPPSVIPRSYDDPAPPSYTSNEYIEYDEEQDDDIYRTSQYSAPYTPTQSLPVAIPQVDFGSTSPFIRGYSDILLGSRGISQSQFTGWIDAFNAASTPSAEMQVLGKAAGIAGYFVPGAAGLIPTAVQIGAGLSGYASKRSAMAECLARGNTELFNRAGLQIIICNTQELEQTIGYVRMSTPFTDPNRLAHDVPSRLEAYSNYLSPLSTILPPALPPKTANSPVAGMGARMSERDRVKALGRAQKDASKGKSKRADSLEADLKWILIIPRM